MKRVLHIVASMDPAGGGVAQAVRTLAAGLKGRGYESAVVSVDAPEAAFLAGEGRSEPAVEALGPGRFGWAYNKALKDWLVAHGEEFDVWIVHGLWLYPSWLGVTAGEAMGRPVYVFPHGMLDPWFQSWRRRPIKTLRNILYWHFLEAGTVRRATGLLFTCDEERRLAAMTFTRYRPNITEVVGLGNADVPPMDASPLTAFVRHSPRVASRYLLFLGRIHPKKGLPLLLEGWARATKEIPLDQIPHLVIAGPGEDSPHGLEMKALVDRLNPVGSVHFTGMLNGSAKWAALRGAEAFVLFSHQENFGIAVVEALACGTPVLLSNKVNIWREVVAGGGGIAASDTVCGATDCLRSWFRLTLHDRETARARARATYLSTFSADAAAECLVRVLKKQTSEKWPPEK